MLREVAEAADACAHQVAANRTLVRDLGARLRRLAPPFAATLARGSSDHAASFGKVLFELTCAMPTLSHSPSTGALYHATSPRFAGVPLFAVSQSGQSPDLLAAAAEAKEQGAFVTAIVNDTGSPLGTLADVTVPLHAGSENSVAATKSFIASLVAFAHLAAEWGGDPSLSVAVMEVGDALTATGVDRWRQAVPLLEDRERLLVLGRGYTLPIAGEAALKLKEVAGIHAEAFSLAEVAHGPMTLIGEGDAVLVFGPLDQAREGVRQRLADFMDRGARVISSGHPDDIAGVALPLPGDPAQHPAIAAIADIFGFYHLAEALAAARGRDPDSPPFLRKVTRTL